MLSSFYFATTMVVNGGRNGPGKDFLYSAPCVYVEFIIYIIYGHIYGDCLMDSICG